MNNSSNWFIKLLNLRPEEGKPVLYLMVFSFFVGLSMSFYFAASNAIFLRHFEPKMISVSYMASGIIVWFAWFVLSRLDRWLKLSWQLIVKFLFVFASVLIISVGVWKYDSPWIVFIMYTWVRILTYITLITFWGLAGKLFNIRQGKRLFSLLGTGEVISIIIGYFSIPLLLTFLKAADLLFLASITLLVCFVLVLIILNVFRKELSGAGVQAAISVRKSNEYSYWTLIRKPYFRLISLMALLPIFAYLFVDFIFLSQTKLEFAGNTEAIAGFLGIFLGFVAIVELIFKLVSGRILSRFGLKPSLFVLPLILAFSVLLAAVSGSLYGQVGLFFAFIAMARLLERSVRSAMYEPSFQLLYQPVPAEQRLIFQNQIEGIPKAFGTVLTGALILLFSWLPAANLVHFNWFYLSVLIFWGWIALKMYDSYRSMLKNKLFELKSNESAEKKKPEEVMLDALPALSLAEFSQFLAILETSGPDRMEYLIRTYGPYANSHHCKLLVECMLKREMDPGMILSFIGEDRQNEFDWAVLQKQAGSRQISFDELSTFSKSENESDRLKAAFLLGASGRYNTFRLLIQLMQDDSPDVRRAAVFACSKIRRIELFPSLIEQLKEDTMREFTARLLHFCGEPIQPDLSRLFEKSHGNLPLQLKVIQISARIQSQSSLRFLKDRINHPSRDIRFAIIKELSRLNYHCTPSEAILVKSLAENTVTDILWIYSTMNDLGSDPALNEVQLALLTELDEQKEFIFLLLSLLYDSNTIHHIREHIESKDNTARIYALEISDMIMSQDVKEYFFPIFEDHSIAEKLNRFAQKFPQSSSGVMERLIEIINREYNRVTLFTKASALLAFPNLSMSTSPEVIRSLKATLSHPDPVLSQLAAWALYRIDSIVFAEYLNFLIPRGWSHLNEMKMLVLNRSKNATMLDFEKIKLLRTLSIFALYSDNELIDFVIRYPELLQMESIQSDQVNFHQGREGFYYRDNEWQIPMNPDLIFELFSQSADSSSIFFSQYSSIFSKN